MLKSFARTLLLNTSLVAIGLSAYLFVSDWSAVNVFWKAGRLTDLGAYLLLALVVSPIAFVAWRLRNFPDNYWPTSYREAYYMIRKGL